MFDYVFSMLPPSRMDAVFTPVSDKLLHKKINQLDIKPHGYKVTLHNSLLLLAIYEDHLDNHPKKDKPLRERLDEEFSSSERAGFTSKFWDNVDWLQTIINSGELRSVYYKFKK